MVIAALQAAPPVPAKRLAPFRGCSVARVIDSASEAIQGEVVSSLQCRNRGEPMVMIETVAKIDEEGTLTARTPASAPRGTMRVVIVIDNGASEGQATPEKRKLPDLSEFRA